MPKRRMITKDVQSVKLYVWSGRLRNSSQEAFLSFGVRLLAQRLGRRPPPLARCTEVLHYKMPQQHVFATMRIGYARISASDQDIAAERAALKAAGCEVVFHEKASGGRWDRPELHRVLDQLNKGDVVVVWKLDRLSRSLHDVLIIMERIQDKKAGFRSLIESIDTTTPAGRMMMQMVASFTEFERGMLKERTRIGLDSARKDGRIGGRRPKLKARQQEEILRMVTKGKKTAADAARLFGVHRATVTRLLQRRLAA
jgi:DNA invertase Pin-like site-specific DNA recombinase